MLINYITILNNNILTFLNSINHTISDYYIVTKIPDYIKKKYKDGIIKADLLLTNYLKKNLLFNGDWNICITKNNYMYNYPFTFENIIFMPINYQSNFIETLIHERIHICQRYNINEWANLINKQWKINNNIKLKGIINPDTYYIKYTFNDYYGYLTRENNDIKINWINIYTNETKDLKLKYEHPFELLAYKLSEKIINL